MAPASPINGLPPEALLDRIAEAITIVGPNGRRLHANEAARQILGALDVELDARPVGVDGRSAVDTNGHPVAPDDLPIEVTRLTGTELSEVEIGVSNLAGELHWLRMSTRRLSAEGPPYSVIASFTDVTAARGRDAAVEAERIRHEAIIEALHEGVVLQDATGRIVSGNRRAEALMGMTSEQMRGLTSLDRRYPTVHPDGSVWEPEDFPTRRVLATGEPQLDQLMGVTGADGQLRWLQVNAVPIDDGVVATFLDISDRLEREAELRRANELFSTAFAEAPIGIALVGLDGTFLKVNRALCELVGFPEPELLKLTFQDITISEDLDDDLALLEETLAGRRSGYHLQKRYRHADGHVIWVQLSVALVSDADGRPLHFVSQIQDITERRELEERLTELAERDPLTGLLNRRRFEAELEHQLARTARHDESAALVMIDLDGFKAVNDRYGHHAGDEVLIAVSAALSDRVRETDTLARLGGDEFAVLLVGVDADSLADAVAALGTAADRGGLGRGVTASVGGAVVKRDDGPDEILARADRAMYAAKRAKRP